MAIKGEFLFLMEERVDGVPEKHRMVSVYRWKTGELVKHFDGCRLLAITDDRVCMAYERTSNIARPEQEFQIYRFPTMEKLHSIKPSVWTWNNVFVDEAKKLLYLIDNEYTNFSERIYKIRVIKIDLTTGEIQQERLSQNTIGGGSSSRSLHYISGTPYFIIWYPSGDTPEVSLYEVDAFLKSGQSSTDGKIMTIQRDHHSHNSSNTLNGFGVGKDHVYMRVGSLQARMKKSRVRALFDEFATKKLKIETIIKFLSQEDGEWLMVGHPGIQAISPNRTNSNYLWADITMNPFYSIAIHQHGNIGQHQLYEREDGTLIGNTTRSFTIGNSGISTLHISGVSIVAPNGMLLSYLPLLSYFHNRNMSAEQIWTGNNSVQAYGAASKDIIATRDSSTNENRIYVFNNPFHE